MKKSGRPPLSDKLRKVNFGFCAAPALGKKMNKVKGTKSPFICAILTAVPDSMIKAYNSDPEKFISECTFFSLKFDESKSV